jgi:hypothetical protein
MAPLAPSLSVHGRGSDREAVFMETTTDHVTRRRENRQKASGNPEVDPQGLVEFACECAKSDCDRTVKAPLYVYQRILAAGDQYLLQTGHHASPRYRTIVSVGLMSIEERA